MGAEGGCGLSRLFGRGRAKLKKKLHAFFPKKGSIRASPEVKEDIVASPEVDEVITPCSTNERKVLHIRGAARSSPTEIQVDEIIVASPEVDEVITPCSTKERKVLHSRRAASSSPSEIQVHSSDPIPHRFSHQRHTEGKFSNRNKKFEFNSSRVSPVPNGNSRWGPLNISKIFNPIFGSSKKLFPVFVSGSRTVSRPTSPAWRSPSSTTQTPTLRGLTSPRNTIDGAEMTNDGLNQEVFRLKAQQPRGVEKGEGILIEESEATPSRCFWEDFQMDTGQIASTSHDFIISTNGMWKSPRKSNGLRAGQESTSCTICAWLASPTPVMVASKEPIDCMSIPFEGIMSRTFFENLSFREWVNNGEDHEQDSLIK